MTGVLQEKRTMILALIHRYSKTFIPFATAQQGEPLYTRDWYGQNTITEAADEMHTVPTSVEHLYCVIIIVLHLFQM